jgi:hypothetical protein
MVTSNSSNVISFPPLWQGQGGAARPWLAGQDS